MQKKQRAEYVEGNWGEPFEKWCSKCSYTEGVNEIKVRKLRNLNVVISFLCNTRHKKGKLCCLEIIFILKA